MVRTGKLTTPGTRLNKVMRVSSEKHSKELGLFSQDITFRSYSINENK